MTLAEKCGFGDVDLKTAAWVLQEKIVTSSDHHKHPVDEDFRVSGTKVRTKKVVVVTHEDGTQTNQESHSDILMGTHSDPYLAITPALVANGDRSRELKKVGWKAIENTPGFFTCTKFSEDGKNITDEVQFKITNIAAPPKPEKPAKPVKEPKEPKAPKDPNAPKATRAARTGHSSASAAATATDNATHHSVETAENVAVVGDDE